MTNAASCIVELTVSLFLILLTGNDPHRCYLTHLLWNVQNVLAMRMNRGSNGGIKGYLCLRKLRGMTTFNQRLVLIELS